MSLSHAKIIGFGAYVPENILSNEKLESIVETSDEWITQRTGMKERRIVKDNEYSSDLAIKAVKDLIERNGVSVDDVDHILVSTFTPDFKTPAVSALVQAQFGMVGAGTFDLNAGCTGFAYALSTADALISAGHCKKVLVIAAETVSRTVDYTDRTTCILFGDGAAACLLEKTKGEGSFLGRYFHTDGKLASNITCSNYAQQIYNTPLKANGVIEQNGQHVYKYVIQQVPQGLLHLLESSGYSLDDLDWFVPHSANMRMMETMCDRLPLSPEKVLTSLEYFGNTSSASIPLALWLAQNEGKLKKGDLAALYGFGAGLTHGGVLVRL